MKPPSMPFFTNSRHLLSCLTALILAWVTPASAAVLLQDSFDNGDKAVPDLTTIGNWTNYSNAAVTESGGTLAVTTTSSANSNSSNFSTSVNSTLNPFTDQINISVTDFALTGTGTYADPAAGRFRLGLVSTLGSFYGTDDGFSFEINSNGYGFRLGTKLDAVSADPSGSIASDAFASVITAFDISVTDSTWSLTLYSGTDILYSDSGLWSLGDVDTWGAGTGNDGSSSLLLAVQNNGGGSDPTGAESYTIGSISITTGAVPEPSRLLFLGLALSVMTLKRRRSC